MTNDSKRRTLKWTFRNVYRPTNPENLTEREMSLVEDAVSDFCRFAGGKLEISKIGDDRLKLFTNSLRAEGKSAKFSRTRRMRVQKVVHHAFPIAVDGPTSTPGNGTLRAYAGHLGTTKLALGQIAGIHQYARQLQLAICELCHFVGEDVLLSDVTPELISQFEESLRGTRKARNYKWLLRRVMRTVDPLLFQRHHGTRGPSIKSRPIPENTTTYYLANLYEQQFEPRRLRSCRPNTKRLYRYALRVFGQYLDRPPTIDDLTNETLDRFAVARRELGITPRSINRDLECLLSIWRWCCRQNIVRQMPDVQLEKVPGEIPVAWLKDDMHHLLRTIRQLKGNVGLYPARDWWAALLQVLFCSGERVGAVMKLDWKSVDRVSRVATFIADNRKGGIKATAVRLSDEAMKALQAIWANDGPVFPWPFHPTYLWSKYSEILQLAGLPNDRLHKFHCIRKTVGSYIEAAGGNATQALRHSHRRYTEAYLDPRITKPQQPVDLLFHLTETATPNFTPLGARGRALEKGNRRAAKLRVSPARRLLRKPVESIDYERREP